MDLQKLSDADLTLLQAEWHQEIAGGTYPLQSAIRSQLELLVEWIRRARVRGDKTADLVDKEVRANAMLHDLSQIEEFREAGDITTVIHIAIEVGGAFFGIAPDEREHVLTERLKRLEHEKTSKEAGINMRNYKKQNAERRAQEIGREFLKADHKQGLRLSELCNDVWGMMVESAFYRDLLPNKPEGLKPWLRPLAQEFPHISKRGAPKK